MSANIKNKPRLRDPFVVRFLIGLLDFAGEMWEAGASIPYKGVRFRNYHDQSFKKGMSNLQRRGIIRRVKNDEIVFTKSGKEWYRGSLLRYHKKLGLPWDKKWRVVMFDIPKEKNNARNIFRQRLKSLGFQMLQKSVFIFPYPCENELAQLAKRLDISSYINVLISETAGFGEAELKKLYGL